MSNRWKIAQYIALGATVLNVIWFYFGVIKSAVSDGSDFVAYLLGICMVIGLLGSVAAYLCGGLWTAIKMAGSMAVWSWRLVPVFPIDLCLLIVMFPIGCMIFVLLPIFPVRKAYKNSLIYG